RTAALMRPCATEPAPPAMAALYTQMVGLAALKSAMILLKPLASPPVVHQPWTSTGVLLASDWHEATGDALGAAVGPLVGADDAPGVGVAGVPLLQAMANSATAASSPP